MRPPQARREKPKVSAFTSAKIDEILKLEPDFVVGFSDIQADIAAALIRQGVEVWISNHRSVDGILDYMRRLGALVGVAARANDYADELQRGLDAIADESAKLPRRPTRLFRGMGRADDQRHPVGRRAGAHRRRRRHLSRARGKIPGHATASSPTAAK